MSWNNWYEKAVKCLDWNAIRRTTAATLILCLLGTQMPLSFAAGSGNSETGRSGSQSDSNTSSSKRSSSDDGDNDGEGGTIISGTITFMDDGTTDLAIFDDLDLRLYVNGTLATGTNMEVKLDKSGAIIATGTNAVIPLVNDLGDTDNGGRRSGTEDGFLTWSWYVEGLPEEDSDGAPYTYSIRDMGYHPATASNANAAPIDGFALFYTDEDGGVVDTDGGWSTSARNLVYVQKGTIQGSFSNEDGAIPLASPANLIPEPDADADFDYINDAYGRIDMGAGSWYIADALMFNPATGDAIIWRGQVDEDGLDGWLIRYDNIGGYADFDDSADYIYEGGTIVNCSTTCQVTGTIVWQDLENTYGKRPDLSDFTLEVTDANGESAPDAVIEIEEGSVPGTWNYMITGLSADGTYKVKASVTGYKEAEEIEFIATAGLSLQNIEMLISTPHSVTIKAEVTGLQASESATLTYTLLADETEYNGIYSYTLYHADGTMETGTRTSSQISVQAGETVVVQLTDTVEATEVNVIRTIPENTGVLLIKDSIDAEENLYVFQYSALKTVEACIVWNDNDNQYYIRPYDSRMEYLDDGKIHLYFTVDGENTQYELSDPDVLEDALERLGLTGWNGFEETGDSTAAEWYYSTAGLPAYTLSAEGDIVKVNYWIEVDNVDGYITTDKGWSQAPDNARFDSWKFIYTSKTKFEIEVLWLDDDLYNSTRPDVADWKETVTLYQVSTNPGIDEAERTKEIDLAAAEDSFSVTADGNLWKIEISDLPEYDEDGFPYTYYLVQGEVFPNSDNDIQNDIKGDISYEAANSNTGRYSSMTDACYQGGVIKNTLTGELEYSATKIWKDGDRDEGERPTVTLTLWRYIKGDVADDEHSYAAAAQVSYDMNGKVVMVTLAGDDVNGYYVKASGDLPAFDKDGHEYIYFVRESLSGINSAQYICEIDNSSGGSDDTFSSQKGYNDGNLIFSGGTFTNRLTGKVNVTATKTWKAKALQGMEEATITVALERKLVSADDSAWERVKDEADQEKTKVIMGFKAETMTKSFSMETWDRYDEDANEYEYRVVEIAVTLEIGGRIYDATDFEYDSATGITSYTIKVGNETYLFSSEIETATTSAGGNDVTLSEAIVNQLKGETVVEIHKYWEKTAYDNLAPSVEELYFHIYRNGVDICEVLGGDGFTHDHGYLVMPVSDNNEVVTKDNSSYYHGVIYSDSLPKYDKDGAEYVYSIREQSYTEPYTGYSGKVEMWYGDEYKTYGFDHYGADVYNGPGKTIPVVKNWLDDGDILHRGAVTVGLFKKSDTTGTPEKTLELNKNNVWSGFFSIDDQYDVTDYFVEEIEIGGNKRNNITRAELEGLNLTVDSEKAYIRTGEHIYQVAETWNEDEGQWVISNLRIGTIDIHLKKQWVAGIMGDLKEYTAIFKLSNQSAQSLSREVTLGYNSVSGLWEYDFLNLPKYDENGALYDWSLAEVSLSVPADEKAVDYRYSLNLTKTKYGDYHTGDVYSYTAKNTKNATDNIRFHKIWKDNNGKDGVSRPDIYLKLYRAVDKDGDGELNDDEYAAAKWLTTQVPQKDTTDDYHWIISYSSLPLYDDDGYSYIYYAQEGMPASVSGGWKTVYLDSLTELGLTNYERTISLNSIRDESYMLEDGIVVNYREGSNFVSGNKIWANMGDYLYVSDYPYNLISLTLYSAILDENGDPILDQEGNPFEALDENGSIMTTGIEYNSKTGNFTYSFGELPKYDKETGSLIRYYVKETLNGNDVGGFTWMMDKTDFTLTNTYYGGKVLSLKVNKEWEFGGAVDRGEPIDGYPKVTFTLYRKLQKYENGTYSDLYTDREETVKGPITLDRATGYVEFLDLPYYGANGHPYRYYIRENGISGYKITVEVASESNAYSNTNSVINLKEKLNEGENEVTITNIFTEETVKIQGTKTWSGDSGWNIRPDIDPGITLTLWRGTGTNYMSYGVQVDAELVWTKGTDNTWTYVFKETTQPFYRYTTTGSSYTYYVKEEAVPGYKDPDSFYSGTASGGTNSRVFTINMTNTLDTTELKVVKKWEDNSNKYGTRPGSITVKLQRSTDNNAAGNTFEDVKYPQDGGGVWTQTLTGSGTTDTGWTATFSGLPKYQITDDAGEAITPIAYTYRAIEVGAYEDYRVVVDSNTSGTTTITNTLESCDLTVLKVWEDKDDQDGIRPSAVVVSLYKTTTEGDVKNGSLVSETNSGKVTNAFTLGAGNHWTYTWSGLPQKSPAGLTYYYYVVEAGTTDEPLVRYTVTYSSDAYAAGTPQTDPVAVIPATGAAAETAITITNTYTPKEMSVSVEKVWVGADGETGLTNAEILPATIIWQLKSRFTGEETWKDVGNAKAALPGDDKKYSKAWGELPVKRKDSSGSSKVIEYRVEEITVPGYETSYFGGKSGVSGDIDHTDEENQKTITVTNRLTAKTQAGVEKIWDDSVPGYNRTDEIATITFKLQRKLAADGGDFQDVTNAGDGSAVTKTITVSGINPISCVFEHLPRYDMSGYEYAYRVVEAYFTLTAEYGGGEIHPDSQDDLYGTIGGYTFSSEYTEAADTVVVDTATGSDATITNTLSLRNVAVEKIWEDADNQDGVRPIAVTVELRYDGKSYDPAKTVTLSNANEWKHEWENLPEKHADGTPFEYSVAEIAMAGLDESQWGTNNGYETSVSGISTSAEQPLTVTNSRTPATINYTVYKYWEDSNEYDWSVDRPDSIQVQLYRQVNQSEPVKVEKGLVTLYAEAKDGHNAWTYTWMELPKYAREGEVETEYGASYEIQYSVKEVMSEDGSGYVSDIDENKITNQLKTTQLSVIKNWEDQNNYYGIRPQTITVQLQRSIDGRTWNNVDGVSQELDAQYSSQTCTFIGLPVRDKDNNPYEYRASETYMDAVKVTNHAALGYKVSYEHEPNDETVITNTLEIVKLTGKKNWEDQGNRYGVRPESIKLTLKSSPEDALAEGLPEALVPEWSKNGNTWTYTYTGLPKYMADGKTIIVYSVEETVDGVYEVSYNEAHTNLTNTMKTGSLAVTKIQDGGYARDFTFRLRLNINGVETLYTGAYSVLESGAAWNDQGEVRQTDESGAIVIRRNQQFVITGLPAGAAYVVTEDPVNRFTLVSTVDSTGVIPYQNAATASFTNKYTYTGGGDGGGDGGGTTPTQPGTEVPTEPSTEDTAPTVPESPSTPGDNGLVEVPGDPPSVIVEDPNGNIIYEGPTDNGYLDTSGWTPGTYTVYLLDDEEVPLGQMLITIADNETPLAELAKTGDTSLPYALLIAIMLGAVGSMTALVLKRKKEEEA